MLIHKAYQFRIFPDKEQAVLINKTIGCSRFVFNHFLATWNDTSQNTGKGLTYSMCSSELHLLKGEYLWLREVDSIAMQSAVKNLADAYRRFFKQQNEAPCCKSKNAVLYHQVHEREGFGDREQAQTS